MVKEYIENLQAENNRKLNELEQEMNELMEDLSGTEHLLDELQREKQSDKMLFSPRAIDPEMEEHIRAMQTDADRIRERMDSVRKMMETEVRNKEKYQRLGEALLEETSSQEETSSRGETPENAGESAPYSELADLVESACSKIEHSISLMSGNKNRSKAELKNVEKMLRDYVKQLQERDNVSRETF